MAEATEEQIKIFVSGSCGPCQEVKKLVQEGHFTKPNVDLVDIETEEGFAQIEKFHLTGVPMAFRGTEQCRLQIDDENQALIIHCPGDPEEVTPDQPEGLPS